MTRPEILAPAGTMESLIAAVRCGADAVYLGGTSLNARRAAAGFDSDALCTAGEICRAHGTKLYLTLNTLTSDAEMPQVRTLLRQAVRAGVDGLIVQDLGVAHIARECCDIPLHASTQMTVQTAAGVHMLSSLGFVRAVLPRELTQREMQAVREQTNLELEVFVHGALCMCVSGQCLMSAVFGSRSGNRGLCAQPCRLSFTAPGGTGHDLSLKDLSLLPHLPLLRDMGINAFKIEGRLKRPEYVAAAVTACKAALDGAATDEIYEELRAVFSRSGFTDGYFTGKTGVSMFGTRQKEDVTAASGVLKNLQSLYESETAVHPVSFSFVGKAGETAALTAVSGDHACTVYGEIPAEAKSRPTDADAVRKALSKCGGTVFYPDEIKTEMQDGLFLPVSSLNALRRDALAQLLQSISTPALHNYTSADIPLQPHTATDIRTYVRFADVSQIPADLTADKIILPLYCGAQTISRYGACVEIPRALFGREETVRKALLDCRAAGVTQAAFASADGLALAKTCGMEPIAFFGSNVMNSYALTVLQSLGVREALLSCELTLRDAAALGTEMPRGVWVYGHLPLMLMRYCPQRNGKTCDACGRTGSLTDRKGVTFPIECRSGCAELLNSQPVYLSDKRADLRNVDFALLYFTRETPSAVASVLRAWENGDMPTGSFTRGLAYRGVL